MKKTSRTAPAKQWGAGGSREGSERAHSKATGPSEMPARRGTADQQNAVAEHICASDAVDPSVEANVMQVMGRAAATSAEMVLELSPHLDLDTGGSRRFADRTAGVSCGDASCSYRFEMGAAHDNLETAQRVAERHSQGAGAVARHFVSLRFRQATGVDTTSDEDLSLEDVLNEDLIADQDPTAIQYIRAFRDQGVDVLWVPGCDDGQVVIVFTQGVEDIADLRRDELGCLVDRSWIWMSSNERDGDRLQRRSRRSWATAKLPSSPFRRWSSARKLGFALWEGVLAFLIAKFAEPFLRLVGAPVAVPLIPVVLVTLVIGWFLGAKLLELRDWMRGLRSRSWAARLNRQEARIAAIDREIYRLWQVAGQSGNRPRRDRREEDGR